MTHKPRHAANPASRQSLLAIDSSRETPPGPSAKPDDKQHLLQPNLDQGTKMRDLRHEVYQAEIPGERRNSRGPTSLTAPKIPEFGNPRKKVKLNYNNGKDDGEPAKDAELDSLLTMEKARKNAAVEEYNEWVPPPDLTSESEQMNQRWSRSRSEFSETAAGAGAEDGNPRKMRKLS